MGDETARTMLRSSKKKNFLWIAVVALLSLIIVIFSVRTCGHRIFGEVFFEHSSRDHRELHRLAMEAEPVRLAVEAYMADRGRVPAKLTDLPTPHPLPLEDRQFITPNGKRWKYLSHEEEPTIYILGLSINWDDVLTYRNRHRQGWQYEPGGETAWPIGPDR